MAQNKNNIPKLEIGKDAQKSFQNKAKMNRNKRNMSTRRTIC
jgi:hypothetical protein